MLSNTTVTSEDVRDGLRRIRWWEPLPGALAVIAIRFSQGQLAHSGQSEAIRVALMLLPIPVIAIAIWTMVRRHRNNDELIRDVASAGATKALILTALGLVAFAQVELAFGKGASGFHTKDLWMLPLLAYVVMSVLGLRRYTRR